VALAAAAKLRHPSAELRVREGYYAE